MDDFFFFELCLNRFGHISLESVSFPFTEFPQKQ